MDDTNSKKSVRVASLWAAYQAMEEDDSRAVGILQQLVDLDTGDSLAWSALGKTLADVPGKTRDAAHAEMEQSLIDRTDDAGWVNAAICYANVGDLTRAAALWEVAALQQELTYHSDPSNYDGDGYDPPVFYVGSVFSLAADANRTAGNLRRAEYCYAKALSYWPTIEAEMRELPED